MCTGVVVVTSILTFLKKFGLKDKFTILLKVFDHFTNLLNPFLVDDTIIYTVHHRSLLLLLIDVVDSEEIASKVDLLFAHCLNYVSVQL